LAAQNVSNLRLSGLPLFEKEIKAKVAFKVMKILDEL